MPSPRDCTHAATFVRGAVGGLALLAVAASVIDCAEGYNTSSYAIAAGVAAAAGAMQIAESAAARNQSSGGSCALQTCGGCCDEKGFCWSGGSDSTCGAGGSRCEDCTETSAQCSGGACYSQGSGTAPGPWVGTWNPAAAASVCEVTACPRCALGSACCNALGGCACSLGSLCP